MNLIEIDDVTRRDERSGRCLLEHVSLALAAGSRTGLSGPSGSGKSTLLRAIAMLDRCQGRIRFRGTVVHGDAIPAYRRRVIYLTQRPGFAAGTVRDNLRLPFRLASAQQSYDETVVLSWLQRFGKDDDFLNQMTDSLSGGEQQMVALVRALSLRPVVLLLDEPTASLDRATTTRFEQLVQWWHDEDARDSGPTRALVWAGHDESQLTRMTDASVHMRNGRLTTDAADE